MCIKLKKWRFVNYRPVDDLLFQQIVDIATSTTFGLVAGECGPLVTDSELEEDKTADIVIRDFKNKLKN